MSGENEAPETTPLLDATKDGNVGAIKDLIKADAEGVNAANKWGVTPLHHVARYKHDDAMKALLAAKADIEAKDAGGFDAMTWAASTNNVSGARILIGAGADVVGNKRGPTPLHKSVHKGGSHDAVTKVLLEANADPTAPDEEDCCPLYFAALKGHVSTAEILLKAKADVNGSGPVKFHWKVIHAAVDKGSPEMMKLLLDNKVDVTAEIDAYDVIKGEMGEGGKTALDLAIQKEVLRTSGHDEIVKMLESIDAPKTGRL